MTTLFFSSFWIRAPYILLLTLNDWYFRKLANKLRLQSIKYWGLVKIVVLNIEKTV